VLSEVEPNLGSENRDFDLNGDFSPTHSTREEFETLPLIAGEARQVVPIRA